MQIGGSRHRGERGEIPADPVFDGEGLKFHRIGPRLSGGVYQLQRRFFVLIVIGADLRDDQAGLILPDLAVPDLKSLLISFTHFHTTIVSAGRLFAPRA